MDHTASNTSTSSIFFGPFTRITHTILLREDEIEALKDGKVIIDHHTIEGTQIDTTIKKNDREIK